MKPIQFCDDYQIYLSGPDIIKHPLQLITLFFCAGYTRIDIFARRNEIIPLADVFPERVKLRGDAVPFFFLSRCRNAKRERK